MDSHTHQVLLECDSATDYEYPAGFDWSASMRQVRAFKADAEEILGQPLAIDENIQDASYFTELFVPEVRSSSPDGPTVLVYKIAIRFSAFGRLAAIHADGSSDLSRYPVDRLVSLLGKHGFVYIDLESLDEPYDGKIEAMRGKWSWWLRYFDYL